MLTQGRSNRLPKWRKDDGPGEGGWADGAIFGPLKERAEVIDDGGTLLGYFEPVADREEDSYRRASLLFDPEEVRQSQQDVGPCRTTDELIDRLRSTGDA